MEISMSLAQVFGPLFAIGGLGLLINMKKAKKMVGELEKNYALMFFMSFFLIILGMILVLSHNVWEFSWKLILTLIAWGTLVKGALFMLVPDPFIKFAKKFAKMPWCYPVGGVVWLVFGLVLCYFGFFG